MKNKNKKIKICDYFLYLSIVIYANLNSDIKIGIIIIFLGLLSGFKFT